MHLEDTDTVLALWLEGSVRAHSFLPRTYWQDRMQEMREMYLPASVTAVWQDDDSQEVHGFISLVDNYVAALFVREDRQGKGIGTRLLEWARSRHASLELAAYSCNEAAVRFYRQRGLRIVAERKDTHTGQREWVMRLSENDGDGR